MELNRLHLAATEVVGILMVSGLAVGLALVVIVLGLGA
jgi:hypothetical protein